MLCEIAGRKETLQVRLSRTKPLYSLVKPSRADLTKKKIQAGGGLSNLLFEGRTLNNPRFSKISLHNDLESPLKTCTIEDNLEPSCVFRLRLYVEKTICQDSLCFIFVR